MAEQCKRCGRIWSPSKMESDSFPGSACDLGECLCGACEAGDPCPAHDGDPAPPGARERLGIGEAMALAGFAGVALGHSMARRADEARDQRHFALQNLCSALEARASLLGDGPLSALVRDLRQVVDKGP